MVVADLAPVAADELLLCLVPALVGRELLQERQSVYDISARRKTEAKGHDNVELEPAKATRLLNAFLECKNLLVLSEELNTISLKTFP